MVRKNISMTAWFVLGAVLLFSMPQVASAQALTASQSFVSGVTMLVTFLIGVLNFLAWLLLAALDLVMNPALIFGTGPGGAEGPLLGMLREIWQFTRDLVNLGFALGLIIGAVLMIVTADGTKIKEHLPRFVLAVVLVNLSWFIPRVLFDVSQVMTYTVYQLPTLIGQNDCTIPPTTADPVRRPCEVILQFLFFDDTSRLIPDADGRLMDERYGTRGWRCPLPSLVCYQTVPINDAPAEVRTSTKVLEGLIVNHARLQWLAEIRPTEAEARLPEGLPLHTAFFRLSGIIIKLIIALIIHIAIVFPLAAMVAAFFIRIPVLWVSMAFMPLVALGFVFKPLQSDEYGDLFWKWKDHFLQAVFLPVRVAIPFTIGFIMLNAGNAIDVNMMPEEFRTTAIIPLFIGVNDLWQMLWMGIALFIIWKYSFDALSAEKAGAFMGMFTEQIKSVGSSLGSVAMQIPTSIPFIPLPGRTVRDAATGKEVQEKASLGQLLRGVDPRRWRDELRLGRVDAGTAGRILGLQGSQVASPQAVSQIRANTRVTQNVTTNFNLATGGGRSEQEQRKLVRDSINEVRRIPGLEAMNDEQIVRNLRAAQVITSDAQLQQIEEILRRERAAGGGGPAPAPNPPPVNP